MTQGAAETFPGYDRILGPETLSAGDRLVRTPRDYLMWQAALVIVRGGRVWAPKTPVAVYINAGRYVADCPYCRKGMLTRPDWGIACCGECGAYYRREFVIFPDDISAAAAILQRRPNRDSQNWRNPHDPRPFQSIADLERENREELHLC